MIIRDRILKSGPWPMRMLPRQYRKTLADVMQPLNFVQDGLNRHKRHRLGLRRREWSSVSEW